MTDDPAIALRQRIARGSYAQTLLSDPTLEAVLSAIEEDAIAAWRAAVGPVGMQTREASHAIVRGLDLIQGQLRAWFDDGELAREALADLTDAEQED
jgi:hypothetical protein